MGFKIWRKDSQGWSLAFDIVYDTKDLAEDRIAELNAVWHDKIRFGELAFYAYPEDIKINKSGEIIDDKLTSIYKKRLPKHKKRNGKRKRSPNNRNMKGHERHSLRN